MGGVKTSQEKISVELFEQFDKEYFFRGNAASGYVTCKAFSNALVGVILIDFDMNSGFYRWQYISHGIGSHQNMGFFFHRRVDEALNAAITYFHIFTQGKYRGYSIWWR